MRAVLVAVLALALAAPAEAVVVQFRTPSSNIGCVFSTEATLGGGYIRCDILSGLKPKPPRRGCDLDQTGYELSPRGRATIVCAGDTALSNGGPTLAYGKSKTVGRFKCTSKTSGMTCKNKRNGHGFFISKQKYRLF